MTASPEGEKASGVAGFRVTGVAPLPDCYGPLAMPPPLAKAHRRRWGRAVDFAYRPQAFPDEARSVAFLFDRYEALTNALFAS
jgi:hypothetical protein